jgi:DNA-binding NarL/FixJ family response regulator
VTGAQLLEGLKVDEGGEQLMARTVTPRAATASAEMALSYTTPRPRPAPARAPLALNSPLYPNPPVPSTGISIGLIGGRRLTREATARLIAAQDGLELRGTFESASSFLTGCSASSPNVLLVDCDRDTEGWLATLTELTVAHTPSLIAMLCAGISPEIVDYAMNNHVGGVILKSYCARDIRDSIAYMNSGHTVLPCGWQETVSGTTRKCLTLSPRHRQILQMIAEGSSNEEIAHTLSLSPNTVKFHVRALYSRLGVRNRVEAARRHARLEDASP